MEHSPEGEQLVELLRDINRYRKNSAEIPRKKALRWIRRLEPDPAPEEIDSPHSTLRERLGRPEQKLFSYGTLQPGRQNHHVAERFGGRWFSATTRGRRWVMRGRFPALRWNPEGEVVEGSLLLSGRIDWERLDAFEGSLYNRILLPVEIREDEHAVANAYEAA